MSNEQLQNFMSSIGLRENALGHSETDTAHATADNCISLLNHYGLLAIEGPDAGKFLQGQTSCDISQVSTKRSSPGSYCNPKGRMLSSFLIAQPDSGAYLLRMRRPLVDSTQTALSKYIVFSKAEQRNVNDEYIAVGLCGPQAGVTVAKLVGETPQGKYASVSLQGNLAIQLDDEGSIFECWIKQTELATLWPVLSDGLTLTGSGYWELQTIRLGLGDVCEQTTDLFIPQMLNYQLIGAVSFNKGCYTGQEIVARMQYRGKLKRAMYRIQTPGPALLPGTELFSSAEQGNRQSIGTIVNSAAANADYSESLAVITHRAVDSKQVTLAGTNQPVEIMSLPYAINKDEG